MIYKKTTYLPVDSDFEEYLKGSGCKYRLEFTNNTSVIFFDGSKYILSDELLLPYELRFIQSVKKYSEKLNIELPDFIASRIEYFSTGNIRNGVYYDVCEVDINSAYWEAAAKNNFISNDIYLKGVNKFPGQKDKISKKCRLIALGSLATVKTIVDFDGSDYKYVSTKKNNKTRKYFFKCALDISKVMKDAINESGGSVLFHWCDAIFIHANYVDSVMSFFNERGYSVKVKKLNCIHVKGSKMTVSEIVKSENQDLFTNFRMKTFNIRSEYKRLKKQKDDFLNNLKHIDNA